MREVVGSRHRLFHYPRGGALVAAVVAARVGRGVRMGPLLRPQLGLWVRLFEGGVDREVRPFLRLRPWL